MSEASEAYQVDRDRCCRLNIPWYLSSSPSKCTLVSSPPEEPNTVLGYMEQAVECNVLIYVNKTQEEKYICVHFPEE